ncbi:alpha/beta-type small acid-soluble spore protein [Paenibacillus piri]|uniref:Alpha/beta-type small acid-soluble spore protein n=1 Tax=Paenibacillus piri TaxID=2547395 RepID=A0A4R5KAI4_9BACL|nr:alpha/beta-type small acid-soluble spore protein [Paenibacillus piri]TDF91872.1 alpha/beta-type small acid-soluble spore protein [Paenibacillus piri]
MARRRSRRLVIPEATQGVERFKAELMRQKGYAVNADDPQKVKYEVARSMGIPLTQGYNGQLSTEQAGKIGGEIGGSMVREMIRMAQQKLAESGRTTAEPFRR